MSVELEIHGKDTLTPKLRQSREEVGRFRRAAGGASDHVRQKFALVGRGAQLMQRGIQAAASRSVAALRFMQTGADRMQAFLRRSMQYAKFAIAGVAVAGTLVGASFEQSMANVSSVAGGTQKDLVALSTTARQWGATTAFSARNVGDAMYSLASAGQSTIEIQQSVGGVLKFAGAAATDMGLAAELTTSTLKAFNLQAKDTDRVINTFAASIAGSRLNADRLAASLPYVASTAHIVGLEVEDTVAALGLLVDRGLEASTAGTGLNQVITQLLKPNAVLRDILGEVNIVSHGLVGVIQRLQEVSPDEGTLVRAFGDVRAARAGITLMSAGTEELKRFRAEITGTNKAAELYEKQMDTVQAQFKIFKSAVEESMIASFEALKPEIRSALETLIRWVERSRAAIVGLIATTIDWAREHASALVTLAKTAGIIGSIVVAWALLNSPIFVTISLLALAAAAFIKWEDQVRAGVRAAGTNVSRFANKFIEDHGAAIRGALGFFKGFANAVIGFAVFIGLNFYDLGRTIVDALRGPFQWVIDRIGDLINFAGPLLKKLGVAFGQEFDEIRAKLESSSGEQKNIIQQTTDAINANAAKAWGTDYVGAVVDGVTIAAEKVGEGMQLAHSKFSEGMAGIVEEGKRRLAGQLVAEVEVNTPEAAKPKLAPSPIPTEALNAAVLAQKVHNERIVELENIRIMRTVAADRQHTAEWLAARTAMIDQHYDAEITKAGGNATKLAEIEIERSREVAEARMMHQDAVIAHWMQTHQLQVAGLISLEAAYDTFFDTILDKEMTGKERREAMWESMKRTWVRTTADMAKAWIGNFLKSMLVAEAAQDAHSKKQRLVDAKAGAVKAYSAFASIPLVGPILGAAAAAAAFAFLMAFNKGGLVPGSGPNRDSQLVYVTPGEYVVQRPAVDALGVSTLDYINRNRQLPLDNVVPLPGASSSPVPSLAVSPSIGPIGVRGGGNTIQLNFQVSATRKSDADEIREMVEDEVIPVLEEKLADRRFRVEVDAA